MKYYTYKITFKDLPGYFYYGRHKDDGKPYFGSPKTWRHLWSYFEAEVQVLQWYETAEEVDSAEKAIIRATWDSKYSLNEAIGARVSEEVCRKNGERCYANNFDPHRSENGRINVSRMSREAMIRGAANRPRAARVAGAANQPREVRVNNGKASAKITTAQKWQCLVTGFVANPGNLAQYQRARGIDTSLRIKLEG